MWRKNWRLYAMMLLLSTGCNSTAKLTSVTTQKYVFSQDAYTSTDSSMVSEIAPYKTKVDEEMNQVIGISDVALEKNQPEGLLGNFVSDASLETARKVLVDQQPVKIDFAVFNNGGLRNPLPKGNLTKGNVFELMPFENELVVVTLSGSNTLKLLNYIAFKDGVPVSGIRMKLSNKTPVDITINNMPFDSTKSYSVLTSDYLSNGGDDLFFLSESPQQYINLKLRNALLDYISEQSKKGLHITSQFDQRISYAK